MKLPAILFASAALLACSTGIAAASTAVADADVNLRSGPGTEYDVIAVIPNGAAVDVRNCTAQWCRVRYAGNEGWASSTYIGAGYGNGPVVVETEPDYGYDTGPDYYGPAIGFGGGFAIGGYRHFHRGHLHARGGMHFRGRPGARGTAAAGQFGNPGGMPHAGHMASHTVGHMERHMGGHMGGQVGARFGGHPGNFGGVHAHASTPHMAASAPRAGRAAVGGGGHGRHPG